MKRIRIMGLAVVALCAMAVTATTASAAEIAPELGRCLATVGGKYKTNKCTVEGASKKPFEWFPGPGAKPNFTVEGGKATLESVGKNTITCATFGGSGTLEGTQKDKSTVLFKSCESVTFKVSCQSVGKVGEIEVFLNSKKGNIAAKKYGSLITGQGVHVAEFECGGGGTGKGASVVVDGSLIGEEKTANKMSLTSTQKFLASKGIQKPLKFSGKFGEGTESHFLTTTTGGKEEQSGQTNSDTIKNEELLETRTEKSP